MLKRITILTALAGAAGILVTAITNAHAMAGSPAAFANSAQASAAPASTGDLLSAREVRDLIANAKTPAEHRKLGRHFAAVAARYEADAADHAAEAKAYRAGPSASESKRPGSPDTALHCDRLADAARNAAAAARELARDHDRMAAR